MFKVIPIITCEINLKIQDYSVNLRNSNSDRELQTYHMKFEQDLKKIFKFKMNYLYNRLRIKNIIYNAFLG